MFLIDTNVFLALVRADDPLTPYATADGNRFRNPTFGTVPAVLAEVCHMVPDSRGRQRFAGALAALHVQIVTEVEQNHLTAVFAWLERYGEHRPDWADASLVIASAIIPSARVWTYDSEFRTIWRQPDGSRVPLAVRA